MDINNVSRKSKIFDSLPTKIISSSVEIWMKMRIFGNEVKPGVNLVYINYDSRDGKLAIFENLEEDSYAQLFQNQIVIV